MITEEKRQEIRDDLKTQFSKPWSMAQMKTKNGFKVYEVSRNVWEGLKQYPVGTRVEMRLAYLDLLSDFIPVDWRHWDSKTGGSVQTHRAHDRDVRDIECRIGQDSLEEKEDKLLDFWWQHKLAGDGLRVIKM